MGKPLPRRELEVPGDRFGVSIQSRSCDRKLSPVILERLEDGRRRPVAQGPYCSSTYVSIEATCPDACRFKAEGCYVNAGAARWAMERLDAQARDLTPLEVSLTEADEIDRMYARSYIPQDGAKGGRDLRLHVGGEVSCTNGARALAAAARGWRNRQGGDVWTYTHKWREIPVTVWRGISVFASVETEAEALEADRHGYQVALTVAEFPRGPKAWQLGPLNVIPCPFESGAPLTCVECRLCLRGDFNRTRRGIRSAIAFAVHGPEAEPTRKRLAVLQ